MRDEGDEKFENLKNIEYSVGTQITFFFHKNIYTSQVIAWCSDKKNLYRPIIKILSKY